MATRDAHDDRIEAALEQSRAGGQAGCTELYRVLAGRVAGYVRGRGVRDVDDLTNEIFLAAFQQLPSREFTAAGFRAWLFGIAFNKTADWHRAQHRRPAAYADVDTDHHPAGDTEADALAALGDDRVDELLGRLTEDQRNVLLLRVVADFSLDETAITLDKPVGAVKSLQRRALDALRRGVADELDEEQNDEPVSPGEPRTMTGSR